MLSQENNNFLNLLSSKLFILPMLFTISTSIIAIYSGYFCYSGSNSSTPNLDSDGDECPTGQYCPAGSVQPTACPPGTYNPTTRRESVDQCTNCTAGYYCSEYNMTAAGPQCDTGRENSFYARRRKIYNKKLYSTC